MFEFKDRDSGETKQISVATYFVKKLGIQLEFPHLQCVEVRTGPNLKGFNSLFICLLLYLISTSNIVCSNASTNSKGVQFVIRKLGIQLELPRLHCVEVLETIANTPLLRSWPLLAIPSSIKLSVLAHVMLMRGCRGEWDDQRVIVPWRRAAYQVCYDWGMLHKVVHVPMHTPKATCTTACNVHQSLA